MRALGCLLGLALAHAACASEAPPARPPPPAPAAPAGPGDEPGATPPSSLETVPCRFLAPRTIEGQTLRCADLVVPENRRNPSSTSIKLHVAVIKGKEGGVPTVELVGGPGGSSEALVGGIAARTAKMMEVYGRLLEKGDLVLFDQRGTGRSVPRLSCAMDEEPARCRKQLEGKGIDLSAYDTVENADDVHALRLALGVAKIDLHGISYGTRLGIEVLKRHPDDVRAAILDGVMPSDVPLGGGFETALDGVVSKIFGACAADSKCNQAYPDLDGALEKLKAKLDAAPFQADDAMYGPYPYDWYAFTSELVERAYDEGSAGRLPYWIHQLLTQTEAEWKAARDEETKAADRAVEAEMAADATNPLAAELFELEARANPEDLAAIDMAGGMYFSVTCNDYTQHETLEAALAALTGVRPALRDDFMIRQEFDACTAWPKRESDTNLRRPPTFGGPALVIGGALDPATPASWAERVSATLAHDQLVIVPTGGHGLMDGCGGQLKSAFFSDPDRPLDVSCATGRAIQFFYAAPTARTRPLPRVLLPPPRTPLARIADRVLGASLPELGLGVDMLRRRVALQRL